MIFGWNEVEHESGSGGCFPKPWRSCGMNNPSFPMLGAMFGSNSAEAV